MKMQSKEQMDKLSGNTSVFKKVEAGEMQIRVIGDIYGVMEHAIKIGGKHRAIACPTENKRKQIANGESQDTEVPPCPICEKGNTAKISYLAFIVERETERNGKFYGGEAWVLKKGNSLLGAIQALMDDDNWGKGGDYDVKVVATGEDKMRRYTVMGIPAAKSKPLSAKEQASLADLQAKVSLEEMTTPRPYSEILEIVGDANIEDIPF